MPSPCSSLGGMHEILPIQVGMTTESLTSRQCSWAAFLSVLIHGRELQGDSQPAPLTVGPPRDRPRSQVEVLPSRAGMPCLARSFLLCDEVVDDVQWQAPGELDQVK
jgi:hypothetical protein